MKRKLRKAKPAPQTVDRRAFAAERAGANAGSRKKSEVGKSSSGGQEGAQIGRAGAKRRARRPGARESSSSRWLPSPSGKNAGRAQKSRPTRSAPSESANPRRCVTRQNDRRADRDHAAAPNNPTPVTSRII